YVYAHGAPTDSRSTMRLQIYALSQLGEVKGGSRASYNVLYNEDVDASTIFPGFGSIVATKSSSGSELKRTPWGLIPDAAHQKIIFAFGGGKQLIGVDGAAVVHVMSVSHTP